jgi:hypothetical protein
MTHLAADPAPEAPCRPCQDGEHERCLAPVLSELGWGCCCDALEQEPELPRWHP